MGLKISDNGVYSVIDIRCRIDGEMRKISYIRKNVNGTIYTIWQIGQSTFVDKNGNIFFDINGIPFQGKKQ